MMPLHKHILKRVVAARDRTYRRGHVRTGEEKQKETQGKGHCWGHSWRHSQKMFHVRGGGMSEGTTAHG